MKRVSARDLPPVFPVLVEMTLSTSLMRAGVDLSSSDFLGLFGFVLGFLTISLSYFRRSLSNSRRGYHVFLAMSPILCD